MSKFISKIPLLSVLKTIEYNQNILSILIIFFVFASADGLGISHQI